MSCLISIGDTLKDVSKRDIALFFNKTCIASEAYLLTYDSLEFHLSDLSRQVSSSQQRVLDGAIGEASKLTIMKMDSHWKNIHVHFALLKPLCKKFNIVNPKEDVSPLSLMMENAVSICIIKRFFLDIEVAERRLYEIDAEYQAEDDKVIYTMILDVVQMESKIISEILRQPSACGDDKH